jgi:hypothetical protein
MARAILRVVEKCSDPAGWTVRPAQGKQPLAICPTKQAAVDLAKNHLTSAAGGGTLRVFFANGGLDRTQTFASHSGAASVRAKGSTAARSKTTVQTETVRRIVEGLGAPQVTKESTVALVRGAFSSNEVPTQTVRTWATLSAESRSSLLEDVRSLLNSKAAGAAVYVVDLLLAIAGLPPAAARLRETAQSILAKDNETITRLKDLQGRLGNLEAKIDEGILRTARAAIDHLLKAASATGEKTKAQQLHIAADKFTDLANLDPTETTKGTSGTVSNTELIVLGYWGSHICHELQDERRLALQEAYKCAAKYPLESVMRFHPDYFSRNYLTQVTDQMKALDAARNELHAQQVRRRKVAVAVLTGGAATVASLILLPPLALFTGAMTLDEMAIVKIHSYRERVEKEQAQLESVLERIVQEALGKFEALESVTGADLELLSSKSR